MPEIWQYKKWQYIEYVAERFLIYGSCAHKVWTSDTKYHTKMLQKWRLSSKPDDYNQIWGLYPNHMLILEPFRKYKQTFILTLLLLNTTRPVLAKSVDPGQLASSEANGSGSDCLSLNMWISIKNPDQVIWLARN